MKPLLNNERILITGGAGSLGKAITRYLYSDNHIIVYSRNEERQFEMQQELPSKNISYLIGDVRDQIALQQALTGVSIAIHAAAMKDMIMCEKQPTQCYLNNLEGTRNFLNCVANSTVRKAIGISTDKASDPSNVYGMTKYIMERMFLEANRGTQKEFFCLRLGNLIDARGSLIWSWKKNPNKQIQLTHPDVSRFFVTTKESAKIISGLILKGTAGKIYIPKMKQAKIIDILKIITGQEKFPILGLFPGEKLHESLMSEEEFKHTFDGGEYFCIDLNNENPNPFKPIHSGIAEPFAMNELKEMIYAEE